MSDLISRSVLIENLNSIEFGIDFSQIPYNMPVEKLIEIVSLNTFGIVMEHINAQPTAYDVEKVVAELKDNCNLYPAKYYEENIAIKAVPINNAIDIVRKGGVE